MTKVAKATPKLKRWQSAYAETRRRILNLQLAPGSPLSEVGVAREFGMSATPARDALGRLRQEGLVVVGPGRGYSVATLSVSDVAELAELRFLLEQGIAKLAMRNASADEMTALHRLASEPASDTTADQRIERNERFHLALAELSGNRRLVDMLRAVLQDSQRVFHLGIGGLTPDDMATTHLRLVDAIERRDVELARSVLEEEAFGTSERVLAQLVRGSSRNGNLLGLSAAAPLAAPADAGRVG